jgi:hypothetical protein
MQSKQIGCTLASVEFISNNEEWRRVNTVFFKQMKKMNGKGQAAWKIEVLLVEPFVFFFVEGKFCLGGVELFETLFC